MDSSAIFTNNLSLNYSIDGVPRGDVIANSVPTANRTTYAYNTTLLDVTGLTSAQHTLRVDVKKPSLLLVSCYSPRWILVRAAYLVWPA